MILTLVEALVVSHVRYCISVCGSTSKQNFSRIKKKLQNGMLTKKVLNNVYRRSRPVPTAKVLEQAGPHKRKLKKHG